MMRWLATTAMLTAIALGGYLSAYVLAQEVRIERAERQLAAQAQYLSRHQRLVPDVAPLDLSQPPRALLLESQLRLMQTPFITNEAEHRRMLEEVRRGIDNALSGRPGWGEAQVVLAYLHSLRGAQRADAARSALIESYTNARYLRDAAEWRVRFGVAQWDDLPGLTRDRLINEAVWFIRLKPEYRETIFAAARKSPAYFPLLLRWRDARSLDADLMAN